MAETKTDKPLEPLDVEEGRHGTGEEDDIAILGRVGQNVWIRSARRVSYASIAFTLVGGLTGIILSIVTDSVSLLGYGLESFVDVWSSVLVLWRFWSSDSEDLHKQTAFNKREQRASFGISLTFVCIGVFVAVQAIIHIIHREKEEDAEILLAISAISAVVLAVLASIKFRISKELNSLSLYKDGVSSVAVCLLSVGILLSTAIYDIDPNVWWLDDVVALIVSVCLVLDGSISVYKHRHEIQ